MAVEFSGPIVGLVVAHVLLFDDTLALGISIHLLHLWYMLDHSENLQLYHYHHHQYIDSVYSIYTDLRFPQGRDTVKPMLKLQPPRRAKLKTR